MVTTYGLTHIAVAARDLNQTADFYHRVFGAVKVYESDGFIQLQTPGSRDVLVFEHNAELAGEPGGVMHFGFRLTKPGDIEQAAVEIEAAGGVITDKGEFCPGEPYVFAKDPNGYTIEVWYEIPTPADPPPVG